MGIKKAYKKALKRVKRLAKEYYLSVEYPREYRKAAQAELDPRKVVFIEVREKKLSDSFKLLYRDLTENYDYSVQVIYLRESSSRFMRYHDNCVAMLREIATASYVFLNDASNVVSCVPLREGSQVVQLWHGCGAFKKWGMSTADLKFGGSRREKLRHPYYSNLSLVTTSSPEVNWAYIEAMHLEEDPSVVRALGVSRTDEFFVPEFVHGARHAIEKKIPQVRGKKILLYAPTFRGRVASAKAPDQLDVDLLQREFGEDWVLLTKHHPFVKTPPAVPEECQDFAFDVSGHFAVDTLMCAADAVISDYSSLIFEYSLFERPMAFFAYDKEEYDDWRGFYYDYSELTPGPVCVTTDELVVWLHAVELGFDASEVRAFRQKYMSACNGRSTDAIMRTVFGESLDDHRLPRAYDSLRSRANGPLVSIVIPAHNALPELRDCLNSIVTQSFDLSLAEVVVVDDGSTDGTWELLREYDEKFPGLFTLRRLPEASGTPARPRNEGLRLAQGEYVLFVDADDWLGREALERMMAHAVEWGSDVLYIKMHGEDGRLVPQSMFEQNQPSVDVYRSKVMWSLAPLKLFRHSLVHDLSFPETFMPEDISFVLRALCRARTVSVAADYDYYHVTMRKEEGHQSVTTWDHFESNMHAYEDIFGFVREGVPEGERDWALMRRLFRRDVYRTVFHLGLRDANAQTDEHFQQLKALCEEFWRPDMYETLPWNIRITLEAFFGGHYDGVRSIAKLGDDLIRHCEFTVSDGVLTCSNIIDCPGLTVDLSRCVGAKKAVKTLHESFDY